MLAKEENDYFTRVGPGAPGEMLRRYWHPIGFAAEVKNGPSSVPSLGKTWCSSATITAGMVSCRCAARIAELLWSLAMSKMAVCAGAINFASMYMSMPPLIAIRAPHL